MEMLLQPIYAKAEDCVADKGGVRKVYAKRAEKSATANITS